MTFMGLGFGFICVYPIGIPVIFWFLLRRNQKRLRKQTTDVKGPAARAIKATKAMTPDSHKGSSAYVFLMRDYKPEYYYFECVVRRRSFELASVVLLAANPVELLTLGLTGLAGKAHPHRCVQGLEHH